MSLCALDPPLMLSKYSFSQLLCSHEHKTLSTVSFSFASDANYDAFSLMSPVWGFEDMQIHARARAHTNMHVCPHKRQTDRQLPRRTLTQTHKIVAVPRNYRRGEPLIRRSVASASHHRVFVSPLQFPCGKTQLFLNLPGSQVHSTRQNSKQ